MPHAPCLPRAALCASLALAACQPAAPQPDTSPQAQARVQALLRKTLADMRQIQGGGFWLGDFGPLMDDQAKATNTPPGPDAQDGQGGIFTIDEDNKPARWVTLDTYYIAAHKVTYGDFDVYVQAQGLPKHPPEGDDELYKRVWQRMRTSDDVPAGVTWNQAKAYCLWLGQLSGLPFDLPTEAQWEYAASNRTNSYRHPFPTQSGQLDRGKAHPTFEEKTKLLGRSRVYPVGRYEPSPAGLYDLLGNGFDWTNDWYAPDAYETMTQTHNPPGPASGTLKVLRGMPSNEDYGAFRYLSREARHPNDERYNDKKAWYGNESIRCVVNAASLDKKP